MFICDCHCDTLTKAFTQNQSILKNSNQLDIERIINNGGGLQFFAIWIDEEGKKQGPVLYTLKLIDKFYNELENLRKQNIKYLHIKNKQDITEVLNYPISLLLSIEGGEAIQGSIEVLHMYYKLGVRCMSLTWNTNNELAQGVIESTGKGLSLTGKEVVSEMNKIGMLIDVSHISEEGFWDIAELSQKPIVASHSNAKSICNALRNLSDEQIKAIAKKNGLIGINIYPYFLSNSANDANIDSIYKHIEYIISLCGEDCIGLGTDFDGIDVMPKNILGVQSLYNIFDYLKSKNYTDDVINKISYKNAIRVLSEVM